MSGAALHAAAPGGGAGPAWRRLSAGVALAGLGRGGGLLALAVFAALLPLAEWGVFAHARGLAAAAAPLLTLGLSVSAMRRIPQYRAAGRPRAAAGHAALGCLLAAATLPPAALAAWLWPGEAALAWMIAATPAAAALFFGTQAARALERPALAYAPPGLGALAGAGALALLPAAARDAQAAAAALAAGLSLAAAIQAAGTLRAAGPPRLAGAGAWLAEGGPLALSLAARGATLLGPFLLLPLAAGPEAAGVYGLAWLLAQAPLTALTGVSGATAPRLSAALGRGDAAGARAAARLARRAGAAAALAAGGAPALALALAPEAAEALRPGLAAAAGPLALLTAAALAQALDAPLGAALVARGRGRAELAAQFAGAAVTLAPALALIAAGGATGAAAAVLLGALARLGVTASRRPLSGVGR